MNKNILIKLAFSLLLCLGTVNHFVKAATLRDSIGVEVLNGKKIIVHKVEQGETYYSIARRYNVNVQQFMAFNQNAALKSGGIIKIPTNTSATNIQQSSGQTVKQTTTTIESTTKPANKTVQKTAFIEYKVAQGETLFAIARKFEVSVDKLRSTNNLQGDAISSGQIIRIPNENEATSDVVVISDNDIKNNDTAIKSEAKVAKVVQDTVISKESEDTTKSAEEKTDRYGLKRVTASGVGVWMDDVNGESGKMLALHNSAPVGTVVEITNPMNGRTTYAKVVGKFNDTDQNQGAVIVVSKSVATLIGAIDRRFQVKISY